MTGPASSAPFARHLGGRVQVSARGVGAGWAAVVLVTMALFALAVSPPWLPKGLADGVRLAFALACHQLDERSFHVHDIAFAVCQRCTGLYTGLALGALLWPLASRAVERLLAPRVMTVLLATCVPLGIDWALGATGLWVNTPVSQSLTGAFFGAVAGMLAGRGAGQVTGSAHVNDPSAWAGPAMAVRTDAVVTSERRACSTADFSPCDSR